MVEKNGGEGDGNNKDKTTEVGMRVVIRVRPENSKECKSNTNDDNPLLSLLDDQVLVFDPKIESAPNYFHGKKLQFRDITKKKNKDFKCVFDSVLNQFSTQQEVYEASALDVVKSVVDGYNGSVFAYGATGAGKTHTMLGSIDQPGVIYRTMVDLFNLMEEREETTVFELSVSYMEIYNENIRDLFSPNRPSLPLREGENGAVVISGLTFHSPTTVRELYDMLLSGNQNRTQHPTDANAQSSRSHAIFQVYVRQRPVNSGTTTRFSLSKLSLIDLAGSERAAATSNRAMRMREGANINRSLLALGSCINALAENKKNAHIPFRNSKLTRILKDCLGRNCKTCMIAAVSPSWLTYEDTFNTLSYALRAKSIKSQLNKETINVAEHVGKYQKIIETLRSENERLLNQITSLTEQLKNSAANNNDLNESDAFVDGVSNDSGQNNGNKAAAVKKGSVSSTRSSIGGGAQVRNANIAECNVAVKTLLNKIKSIHTKRADLRKSMLRVESEEKQLKMSTYFLNQMKKLIGLFCIDSDEKERRFNLLVLKEDEIEQKSTKLQAQKNHITTKMQEVEKDFSCAWGEVATRESTAEIDYLSKELHILSQMVEINDLRHQIQHLRSLTERQQHHNTHQSSRIFSIAQFLKCLFLEVQSSNSISAEMSDSFSSLQYSVLDHFNELDFNLNVKDTAASTYTPPLRGVLLDQNTEPEELTGEKFEQILDFTILKPISPNTPALPLHPVCNTPFTGGKISSQSNKADRFLSSNQNRPPGHQVSTATVTKKRKSITPTPKTMKPKQQLLSTRGSGLVAGKKFLPKNGPLFGNSGVGTPLHRGPLSTISSVVNEAATKGTKLTANSIKNNNNSKPTAKKVLPSSDLLDRKRKQAAVPSASIYCSSSSGFSSSSGSSKPLKKSVSSSVMPNIKALHTSNNKVSRSHSRRRSKTPSPVSRTSRKTLTIRQGDTFTKSEMETLLERVNESDGWGKESSFGLGKYNLKTAFDNIDNNRRCTVGGASHITSRLRSGGFNYIGSSNSTLRTGTGINNPSSSLLSAKSFERSSDDFSIQKDIFGTSTLKRLANEDVFSCDRLSDFEKQNDTVVHSSSQPQSSTRGRDTFSPIKNENNEVSPALSSPNLTNRTFVKSSESPLLKNTNDSCGSMDLDLTSRRVTVGGHYWTASHSDNVAQALAKYRRMTMLKSSPSISIKENPS